MWSTRGIWEVRPEQPHDFDAIRHVHESAFEPSQVEAQLVEELRDSEAHVPELCLVAIHDDAVVGHIAFSRAHLAHRREVLALAPMGVLPEHQRHGAGSALVSDGLRRAAETNFPLVVVLGHADYYPRFGFESAGALGVKAPFDVPPEAWMAYRLPTYTPEARGVLVYPEAFDRVT